MSDQPSPSPAEKKPKNVWKQYGEYSQIALILPASVIAGMILGAALDRWLRMEWLTLAGLLLGAVTGFYQLARVVMKLSKDT